MTDSEEQVARWILLGVFLLLACISGGIALDRALSWRQSAETSAVGGGLAVAAGLCVVAASIVFVGGRSRQ